MITLNNLHLSFDDWQLTLNATIEQGSFTAIIGPSGAGKSTLLNAIAGFLPHQAGQILINDQDMAALSPAQRPVSMLFQDHNLFAHMTIGQNVALGINPALKLNKAQWQKVEEVLAQVGLKGFTERLPKELSGGQQQRASLARALLREQPILLLDEPFAALGPALRAEMLELVKKLGQSTGQTILMVTHHPQDAQKAATHTLFIDNGTILQQGDSAHIFKNPCKELSDYIGKTE